MLQSIQLSENKKIDTGYLYFYQNSSEINFRVCSGWVALGKLAKGAASLVGGCLAGPVGCVAGGIGAAVELVETVHYLCSECNGGC